jgi:hypothetical protein
MNKSWIVYGPQACSDTRDAKAIAESFGLSRIRYGWSGDKKTFAQAETLHLTDSLPEWARGNRRVMAFEVAVKRVQVGAT